MDICLPSDVIALTGLLRWSHEEPTQTRLLEGLEGMADANRRARGAPPGPCGREEAGAMQHHRRRSCPNPIEMEPPHVCEGSRLSFCSR